MASGFSPEWAWNRTFAAGIIDASTSECNERFPRAINSGKREPSGTAPGIVFEIARKGGKTELRFTHVGLAPTIECHGGCSGAWAFYVNESLRSLIATGKGDPARKEHRA
jgi:hypothetical protein